MNKNIIGNQRGAVAMITVIFIAIILTIITTSFIRLSINEQRESTDDDLTTRAFYAAESGVQDAIAAIKNGTALAHADECRPETGDGVLSTDLNTAYTCQKIDLTPSNYQASLGENKSVFFVLDSGADNITSFTIDWHMYGDLGEGTNSVSRPSTETGLPPKTDWHDLVDSTKSFPAMLRLQVLELPDGGTTRSDIDNGNIVTFLNPTNDTGSEDLSGVNGGVTEAHCDFSGLRPADYACHMEITSLDDSSNTYYLRIRSIYGPTHLKVTAMDDSGNVTALVNAQAVIDVTGRATDVYRRVEERVTLTDDSLWPDFAILSAEDICKDFVITNIASDFVSNNSPDANYSRSCKF